MNDFEMHLLQNNVRWFKEATPEERHEYIEKRKAKLTSEGRRMYDLVTRGLRRKRIVK